MVEQTENEEQQVVELDPEEAAELAGYDLTRKLSPYLDRHLTLPIILYLQEIGVYEKVDLMRAQLEILEKTNMVDFAADIYTQIGEEVPEALQERRASVLVKLEESRDKVLPLLEILENDEQVATLKAKKSIPEICQEFSIEPDVIEGLVVYAKLQFECGNYSLSTDLLKHYRSILAQDAERTMTTKQIGCLWGSLASFVLNMEMEEAAELILKLDDFLENSKMAKREVLLQRTWLLHWTLFVIFNVAPQAKLPDMVMKLLDLFLNEKSLSIISLSCPHLFRYVGACLILHKRLKHLMKDTVWIIHHEAEKYSDPVTKFLLALYTDMDFDQAQQELKKCERVLKVDFYLKTHWKDFEENARLLIFETYCRIHQCINITMIASKLNMEAEEAELWIVKLIQSAKLDARIDSEKSRVVMSKAPPSVYQQVIERTKNLSFRSTMLLSNLEKREEDRKAGTGVIP
jgi:translation initiation factor 3 subunit E